MNKMITRQNKTSIGVSQEVRNRMREILGKDNDESWDDIMDQALYSIEHMDKEQIKQLAESYNASRQNKS